MREERNLIIDQLTKSMVDFIRDGTMDRACFGIYRGTEMHASKFVNLHGQRNVRLLFKMPKEVGGHTVARIDVDSSNEQTAYKPRGINQRLTNAINKTLPEQIISKQQSIETMQRQITDGEAQLEMANPHIEAVEATRTQWEQLRLALGMTENGEEREEYGSDYPSLRLDAETGRAYDAITGILVEPLRDDDALDMDAEERAAVLI